MSDRDVAPLDSIRLDDGSLTCTVLSPSILTDSLVATASVTGQAYYKELTRYLTRSLEIGGAIVGEVVQWDETQPKRVRSLCFYKNSEICEAIEYDVLCLRGNPPQLSYTVSQDDESIYCIPNAAIASYTQGNERNARTPDCYLGLALRDPKTHRFVSHICIFDDRPLTPTKRQHAETLIRLFAARTTAELKRQQAETREREKIRQLEQTLDALQRTQSQLVQTEKISSLGQLVAGVAHEINNPLGCLSGNLKHIEEYICDLSEHLELYRQHVPQPAPDIEEHADDIDLEFIVEDLPPMLGSMKVSLERIQEIVTSLRQFSRLDADKTLFDVREGLDSTLVVLKHRLKANETRPEIKVVREYSDLPPVPCRPGQLNQVFMNLLSNAIDAIEESNQGRSFRDIQDDPNLICIRTEHITDERGDRVAICIADNGCGISEAVKPHLFETFFTTKPTGKGTGLGLSLSYKVITENHGGTLSFESTSDRGTEFIIELPIEDDGVIMR
ncbi:sensor histidine kinase [Baaleninema simplex]|uniref:sensor histidine kinase n=1 Tax=Baaleninema simplex TaxID=2862350 RepID=UPI000349536B|nr:ATP-binding protein [Baaleninema simplex]